MSDIMFSDGVKFDTSGPYRVERRKDGYYLVGNGVLCPVNSALDGYRLAEEFSRSQEHTDE